MDTKEPHLFAPFKEVETWSLTAKKITMRILEIYV